MSDKWFTNLVMIREWNDGKWFKKELLWSKGLMSDKWFTNLVMIREWNDGKWFKKELLWSKGLMSDKWFTYLVMIREWNDGSTDSQYHGRVYFTVCVGGTVGDVFVLQVIWGHCQHDRLLLQRINILHNTTSHQILPTETQNTCYIVHGLGYL